LQHALPSTSVLIALQGGAVVGTVSLIRDNPLGLPMEADFDVSALRKWGSRIAEVSALAIAPAFRRSGGGGEALLLPLLAYLYRYATYYFGIGYFTATVLSSQARLHQAVFGFEVLGSTGRDKEGREPETGMFLDLRAAAIRFRRARGSASTGGDLARFFLERDFAQFEFPDSRFFKISDPVMSADTLDHFFNKMTDLFSRLNDVQRITLLRQFNQKDYQSVIPGKVGDSQHIDREERFDTEMKGRVFAYGSRGQRIIGANILQVSRSGLRILLDSEISFGTEVTVTAVVGEYEIAELTAFPVWKVERVYGFRITAASQNWERFIDSLLASLGLEDSAA
jgi:hypothetical protein